MYVTQKYKTDPTKAGLIIGVKGQGIKSLRAMEGVVNVDLDQHSSEEFHYLEVTAVCQEVCNKLFWEVQKRIPRNTKYYTTTYGIYCLDEPDTSLGMMYMKPCDIRNEVVFSDTVDIQKKDKMFKLESFGCLDQMNEHYNMDHDVESSNEKDKRKFQELNFGSLANTLDKTVKLASSHYNGRVDFSVSLGKTLFRAPQHQNTLHLIRSKMTGAGQKEYRAQNKCSAAFSHRIQSRYADTIGEFLSLSGFQLLNENSPLTYTALQLKADKENTLFIATLALDENMEELTNPEKTSKSSIKPPTVISVNVKREKLCNITILSTKKMDLKATLGRYPEDNPELNSHIRKVLNSSWEKRDANGKIASPDGQTGIQVLFTKHVKAEWHWVKKEGEDVIMEVVVKEVRDKPDGGNWFDCVEVEIKMVTNDEELTGIKLSDFLRLIKETFGNNSE